MVATSAAISTAGVLAFKGGPDGTKLLHGVAAGEWRRVEPTGGVGMAIFEDASYD